MIFVCASSKNCIRGRHLDRERSDSPINTTKIIDTTGSTWTGPTEKQNHTSNNWQQLATSNWQQTTGNNWQQHLPHHTVLIFHSKTFYIEFNYFSLLNIPFLEVSNICTTYSPLPNMLGRRYVFNFFSSNELVLADKAYMIEESSLQLVEASHHMGKVFQTVKNWYSILGLVFDVRFFNTAMPWLLKIFKNYFQFISCFSIVVVHGIVAPATPVRFREAARNILFSFSLFWLSGTHQNKLWFHVRIIV